MLDVFDQAHQVRAFTDYFDRGTADTDWLREAGGWNPKPVVIGGDGRILKNNVERQALREAAMSYVFLAPGWTNIEWPIFAWKIVKAWPIITQEVENVRVPTVFRVKAGSLKTERIGNVADL